MDRELKDTLRKKKLRELGVVNPQKRTLQGEHATSRECNFSVGKAEKVWFCGSREENGVGSAARSGKGTHLKDLCVLQAKISLCRWVELEQEQ